MVLERNQPARSRRASTPNRFNFRVCRQSGEHKKWRNFRKR